MVTDTLLVSISIRRPTGSFHRSGALTPYLRELVAADIRRWGSDGVEVVVPAGADPTAVIRGLGLSGVRIVVRRERSAA